MCLGRRRDECFERYLDIFFNRPGAVLFTINVVDGVSVTNGSVGVAAVTVEGAEVVVVEDVVAEPLSGCGYVKGTYPGLGVVPLLM